MSKKTICQVPKFWTLDHFERHTCDDYSHGHITLNKARLFESEGRVSWLRAPDARGAGGILSLDAQKTGGVVKMSAPVTMVVVRDRSCRYGEVLVIAAARGEMWALVMIRHMSTRAGSGERLERLDAAARGIDLP